MRSTASPVLSLLLLLLPFTIATSLSQFQSIANFPAPCEKAYDSQISGCTDADFSNGAPCSATCISGLQTLTTQIYSACAGSQADPNTLIGIFFVGKGITALCPNYAAPVASVPAASPSSTKPAVTTTTPSAVLIKTSTIGASGLSTTSSAPPPPPTTTTKPSPSTASMQPAPVSTSTTTLTTTATLVPSTGSPAIDKTAINDGSKTVITSKADQTASSNADAFGGGGSPFEISAGVKGVESASKVALLAVVAGLVLAL